MIHAGKKKTSNPKHSDEECALLHEKAISGDYSVVEKLLKKDCSVVDCENKFRETALVLAAREGYFYTVELLLFAGASIDKQDRNGNTALHFSLMKINDPFSIAPQRPASRAMTAVHNKIQQFHPGCSDDGIGWACYLVQRGADFNCRNKEGKTPLELARRLSISAARLVRFFHVERGLPEIGKCKVCLQATANTCFQPCGHCLYCDDCGSRMDRCLSCKKMIIERVPTGSDRTESSFGAVERKHVSVISGNPPPSPPPEETSAPAGLKTISEMTPSKLHVVAAKMRKKATTKIYSMTCKPRGRCIILNNAHFDNPLLEPRDGSEVDVYRMDALFSQLHFNVTVGSNLRAVEMKDLLRNVSQGESLGDADCLVVILMSHGEKGVIYSTDGQKLRLRQDIYQLFNNESCQGLQGKPKLFFVQACRGEEWDNGTDDVRETSDSPQAPTSGQRRKRIPAWSDMYMAYATPPGYVALKNERIGSWFLWAVSEVFSEHASTMCLEELMNLVSEKVMARYADDGSMQTPSDERIGWTKKLYFNPGHHV